MRADYKALLCSALLCSALLCSNYSPPQKNFNRNLAYFVLIHSFCKELPGAKNI